MSALQLFNGFLIVMVVLAVAVVFALRVTPAGYGQYVGKRWGKTINNRAGWVGRDFRNGWFTNLVLIATLILFSYVAVRKAVETIVRLSG